MSALIPAVVATAPLVATGGPLGLASAETSAAAAETCTIRSTPRLGMRYSQVTCLERRLRDLGLQGSHVDGEFGTVTENAVLAYQRSRRLHRDPNVSADAPGEIPYGSAIFLHRHSYSFDGSAKPTAGCVSLASSKLSYVLGRTSPKVLLAIGPSKYLYKRA